jgi:hypothetical protein
LYRPDVVTLLAKAAMAGEEAPARGGRQSATPGTIGALLGSYQRTPATWTFVKRPRPHPRIGASRAEHGHRTVAVLTRERIVVGILQPYAERPGGVLKMLRVLIRRD